MADIVYIAIVLTFFAICVFYVNWCDRIIGADEDSSTGTTTPAGDPTDTNNTTPNNTTPKNSNTDKQEIAA